MWYTCVSVFTQTLPWPPPGAGELAVFAAAEYAAGLAGAELAAAVLGLNKSPRLNLPGDGEGVGCVAGAGFGLAFFVARCFAGVWDGEGDSAGLGDCPCDIQIPANPTTAMKREILVIIWASVVRAGIIVNPIPRHTAVALRVPLRFSSALEGRACLRYGLPGCST